jgi:hypothetical protein
VPDGTLFGSLVGFTKLQYLVIGPSMLSGPIVLALFAFPDVTQSRESMAKKLSDSLQRLYLVVELD